MPEWKKERAKYMRTHGTPAEANAWEMLRTIRPIGFRFRQQHPCLGYILDFYCPARKLCVEIDGSAHNGQGEYDLRRGQHIADGMGIHTVRYANADVMRHPAEWLAAVIAECERRPIHASWRS